ncbi:NadR-like protein [Pseudogulbenkiania sp. NH8B]|uniref:AAA family ATPase n=1 Tax=Pseudogulbenkiania sp. (strain NH8B) TaxID=748280 RepID=UPI000227A2AF|nr:ATP-binding protein [Pseudogulbenkiania sp. NH8B]BAK78071.1 NadR-like protein [Pseudogulbenkiania sp. NH8B]
MTAYPPPPLRLAIVGPESCGKSTLAQALTASLNGAGVAACCVEEYARDYYAERVYAPTPHDVLAIARGQLAREAEAARHAEVLVCDSTALTCVIWAEVAFGRAAPELAALNRPRDYALTLLACPDLPWQPDPLRSHPDQRDWLWGLYRAALEAAGVLPRPVRGQGTARLEAALTAIRQAGLLKI